MKTPHGWRACRPPVFSREVTDQKHIARAQRVAEQVWPRLPDAERRAFHAYCCLGRTRSKRVQKRLDDLLGRLARMVAE